MEESVRVVVDAMGGDYAPAELVHGAVEAVLTDESVRVILAGRQEDIKKELAKYTYPKDRIEIVHAEEVIETGEPPVNAIRRKKDSSIAVGMRLVKKGEADAFVSSGSTGAVLVGGQLLVGRIRGGASASGSAHSDGKRRVAADRLRRKCGCTVVPPCSVCEDGIRLCEERARH